MFGKIRSAIRDARTSKAIEKAFGGTDMKTISPGQSGEVTSMYAWLVEHPDGTETLPCIIKPANGMATAVPLVTVKLSEANTTLRIWAKELHDDTGYPVRLVRFERCETKFERCETKKELK